MRAICVTRNRTLELRDVAPPGDPAAGHVLVAMDSATITHGDKFFLTHPLPNGTMAGGREDVYGSNGAGRVVAIGADVPPRYLGRQVGIYKTLAPSADTLGLWCETAHVPWRSCLVLPDNLSARGYNGSFANVLTVYAFIAQAMSDGHNGLIVTAGTSATGLIAASLVRRRGMPAIFLTRSASGRDQLAAHGVEHVLLTTEQDFQDRLATLSEHLGTTAVFDGVGGELLGRIIPALPVNATVYVYGFLGAEAATTFSSTLIMARNLCLRRFANLDSATVSDPLRLAAATEKIEAMIEDPLFRTRIGREFDPAAIADAMAYEASSGARAVLVF